MTSLRLKRTTNRKGSISAITTPSASVKNFDLRMRGSVT